MRRYQPQNQKPRFTVDLDLEAWKISISFFKVCFVLSDKVVMEDLSYILWLIFGFFLGVSFALIPVISIQATFFEKAYQRTLDRYGRRLLKGFLLFLYLIFIIFIVFVLIALKID